MATQYSNKPIITNGLVYALDFGNPKSYTTGSNRAVSLVYDPATTIVTGSTTIPTLASEGLTFSGSQFIQRSASLSALDPNGTFTICAVVKANTSGTLFTQNSAVGNLSGRFQSTSSLSTGFTLASGDFSRVYQGIFTGSQHITYRYSSGSFDTFINGIPVTASVANAALTGSGLTSTLFINSGSLPFSGSLSSFYVYSRALTPDEIYQNFQIASTRYGLRYSPKPYTIDENLYQFLQTTGITDTATTTALATFISGLKSNGLWNKMVAIYPFVSNTTSSLTTNLKEPGIYRLGLTGSFSASSAGLTPSSSTAYIDTIPGNTAYASVNSQSAHLTLLSYDLPTGNGFLAGNSARAIGGDLIVSSGSRMYHVYRNVGTSSFVMGDPSITNVEVLVIGGGGSGGSRDAGPGGAGGLTYSSSFSITPNTLLSVVVGVGGASVDNNNSPGGSQTPGLQGANSIFGSIISFGGGNGGTGYNALAAPAGNGGSGGGGGGNSQAGGLGTSGQGNNGGSGSGFDGGGGGGAGSAGLDASLGGHGGSGSYYGQYATLGFGSPVGWFAGGGGGGGGSARGGIGGGGASATSGVINTGGGGGSQRTGGPSGAGGSGIVIVSYNLPASALTGSGTGIYLTDTAVTASVNSQFTSGITGSGNIGLLTVSRTGSGTFSIHKNNVSQSIASASLGALSTDIFFNTANLAGSGSLPLQAGISFASIGSGLTTTEVATYHNLVGQLQTNLKRKNTLLDNYTGAAAAYSLRRIGPSGYFGPAIKVRRDSDNTLRDIGFTSDGQLDTVALLDFVGVTGSGFVNTWYDQSGNSKNATQGNTGLQPFITISGSVTTEDNKVTIYGPAQRQLSAGNLIGPSHTWFSVHSAKPGSDVSVIWMDGTPGYVQIIGYSAYGVYPDGYTTDYFRAGSGAAVQYTSYWGPRQLKTSIYTENYILSDYKFGQLNHTQTFTQPIVASGGTLTFGPWSGGSTSLNRWSEFIYYTGSAQATNRTAIESNINNYYKIYGSATASFDTDYQSFITATGITQPTQSAALETLVSDLKSYGLWNKMKAIYPMITDKNNRFAYSQALATTWNAVNVYVTQSFTTAPDGTFTGNFVSESAVTDTHYIYQTISDGLVTGSEYVTSIYGKFLNRPWIAMETNTGAKAWFNIQTGVTGSLTGSNATITAVSGGWYRCALYFTSSVASGPQNIQYHLADANGNLSYAGVSGTGSYLWGAQFENGNLVGPYRATTTVGFTTGSMLDQMKYNLKNSADTDAAFRLSYSGSWNGGYSGIKPDGVTAWASTKLTPSTDLPLNSTHFSLYLRNTPTNLDYQGTENGNRFMLAYYPNQIYSDHYGASTGRLVTSVTTTKGFMLTSRTGTTSHRVYQNQSLINSTTALSSGGAPASHMYIGGANLGGNSAPPTYYATAPLGFTTIGDGLTDYEAKALYWIVQKYQTTLGRQVY